MSNVTWSDVGAIVVWCVEFKVNFGYVVLPTNMGMGMAPSEHTLSLPLDMLPSLSNLAGSVTSRASTSKPMLMLTMNKHKQSSIAKPMLMPTTNEKSPVVVRIQSCMWIYVQICDRPQC